MNKPLTYISTGCVAAAVAGYLLARQPFAGLEDNGISPAGRDHPVNAGNRDGSREPADPKVKERTAKQLAAVRDDLVLRFKNSPAPKRDWALREQAVAILATMSPAELEEFGKSLMSVDSTRKWDWQDWSKPLLGEIVRQWGLKDPAGACLGLSIGSGQAFKDWLRRDPEAARKWLAGNPFPPGREKSAAQFQQILLNGQAEEDFAAAQASLSTLDTEARKETLLSWSRLLAHDPSKCTELLALLASLGDAEFAERCQQAMIGEMATKSPHDSARFIETMDLPDDQKDKLSHRMLGEWAKQDPRQAFAAWAELKEDAAPAPLLEALDDWSLNSPGAEQAIEWVNKLDPGLAREQLKARLIGHMSNFERYSQAADLSASLEDRAERIRQLKGIKRVWEDRLPKAADNWFSKLPPEDRAALERPPE